MVLYYGNINPFLPSVPFRSVWKHQKTETLFFPMFPFDPSENIRKPKPFSSQCSLLIRLKTSENQSPFLPNIPFWSLWKHQKTKTLFFPMFFFDPSENIRKLKPFSSQCSLLIPLKVFWCFQKESDKIFQSCSKIQLKNQFKYSLKTWIILSQVLVSQGGVYFIVMLQVVGW